MAQTTLAAQTSLLAGNASYLATFQAATSASSLAQLVANAQANWATINPGWSSFITAAQLAAAAAPPPPAAPP